ncbi:MAG: PDZ domain-containing protein [Candidatus Krumholzibacteriota bacterium]|nr:PDZ domain-containing protein [Candidatus Krumholzibacteriota bacterium]
MSKRLVSFVVILVLMAAVPSIAEESSRLMRYPDIHGDMIVFTYGGDLWTVSSEGGLARHLTSHISGEGMAKFSPDGESIAFTGSYDGNSDVYTIPALGGTPKRLTYHPSGDLVVDWHPSGEKVLLRSSRVSKTNPGPRYNRLFTISSDGGYPETLPLFEGELTSYSPDGKKIAYNRMSREFRTWKRYRGGMAQDIWLYDLEKNKSEKLTKFEGTDAFPMWYEDRIYFVSDREHTMNIYCMDRASGQIRKITDHKEYDVKWPSLGDGAIVYENAGYIHVLDLETEKTKRISINVPAELTMKRPHYVNAAKMVRSFGISGEGKRAAFGARGDIFTVPAEKGEPRNLTATSGTRERCPAFSPDGKWVAYFSDKTGEYEIYIEKPDGTGKTERITNKLRNYPFDLLWSPDSEKLLLHDQSYKLYYVDIDKKELHEIAEDDWGDINDYSWSKDGKWVTYVKRGDNGYGSIYVYSIDKGKSYKLTGDFYNDYDPVFGSDGKYLFFLSDRMLNFRFGDKEFNYSFVFPSNLCAMTLKKDTPSLLAPESDEVEIKKEEDKGDDKEKEEEDKDKDKEDKEKSIEIDFEGIRNRIVGLPVGRGNFVGLTATDGKIFFVEVPDIVINAQSVRSMASVELKYYDIKEREVESVISGINGYELSSDGKKIIYSAMGTFGIIDASPGQSIIEGVLDTDLQMKVSPAREWKQIFDEAWRMERDFFYVENMHGVDWEDIKEKYEVMLPALTSRDDLNYVIGEMIGELCIGHAYVGGGDMPRGDKVGVGLLGVDYKIDHKSGRYRFEKIYPGRNWDEDYKAPLNQPGVDIEEGDYLLAVNGRELEYPDNPHRMLENLAGKQVVLKIADNPDGKDSEEYTVVPSSSDIALRYANWVKSNREKTLEASDGDIGYLHVPNTSTGGLQEFARGFYSQTNKKGLVIDVRYNSGGWIPTVFIERLGRKITSMWAQRYGKPGKFPGTAPEGHMACLINQYAGSGGDAFPYFFRQAGLGPLIGKRTWGGLVGMNRHVPLIDGGMVTVPTIGFYEMSGDWGIENVGVKPDIEVENRPDLVVDGRDPQLERAIEYLKEKIEEDKPELPEKPGAPDKS